MAVLFKHHDLGHVVVSLASSVTPPVPPRCLVDVCKIVHQARTALIKVLSLLDLLKIDSLSSCTVQLVVLRDEFGTDFAVTGHFVCFCVCYFRAQWVTSTFAKT